MNSYFASPDRSSDKEIQNEHKLIKENPYIKNVINSLPYITLVLNINRQIVYSNAAFRQLKGKLNGDAFLGFRPGEAFGCIHANQESAGCGTSKFCQYCGAVNTIMQSIKTKKIENNEFHLTYNDGLKQRSMDLSISASPMEVNNKTYIITTLIDISSQKRWQMLEKIFFHDLMNKMGSLFGFIEFINKPQTKALTDDIPPLMLTIGEEIIDEIKAQHNIIQAENNELRIQLQKVSIPEFVDKCVKQMLRHPAADNKFVEFRNEDGKFSAETDPVLLKRVVINLIKNALEAIDCKQTVTVCCKNYMNSIEILVANPGVIPEEAQMQLFVRSFSTKGTNRGLGTYSVKLLTDEYLKGNVVFESNDKVGTVFRILIKTTYPTAAQ